MLPLAERLRPKTLNEYIGQKHLVGEGAILRQMIENGNLSSFILWGPPGVGKTTLARIIAHQLERPFYTLSAVTSGVKEVREVIDKARRYATMNNGLFGGGQESNTHEGDRSVALKLWLLPTKLSHRALQRSGTHPASHCRNQQG